VFSPHHIRTQLAPLAELTAEQPQLIADYLSLLVKWNARTNLTAVRDPQEMLTRHFGESFFAAARLLTPQSTESVIDVGSGAGFPGLPLKIYAPGIRLTLVESQNKKATFLKEVIRTLNLTQAEVLSARAETLDRQAALVTVRAVEKFDQVLPTAARLLEPGGRLALLIGDTQINTARGALRDWHWSDPVAIPGSRARVLLVGTSPF